MSPSHPKKRARLGAPSTRSRGTDRLPQISTRARAWNDSPRTRATSSTRTCSRGSTSGDLAMLALVSRKMRDVVFASPVGDVRDVAAVRRGAREGAELRRVESAGWRGRRKRGCPWNAKTFRCIARVGTWRSRSGRRSEDARGTSGLAPGPRAAATGGCCSGRERTDVRGTSGLATMPRTGGHLEVLQWARANGAPWDEMTCANAALGGHLGGAAVGARERLLPGTRELAPMPRKAATWRCCSGRARTAAPWDEGTCADAAGGGHLEVLQWARANGAPWDEWTCAYAARGGHLEVLQWARANGCPWDERTCAEPRVAATWRCCSGRARTALRGTRDLRQCRGGGHLEVLKWARANGAPWDERTCADAARGGHLEVLQWARANDAPWDPEECKARAWIRMHGDVLRWIAAEVRWRPYQGLG